MLSETKSRLAGKTLIQILFFISLATQICFAQWFWQNPLPTGNDYYSTYFISEDTGWVVGVAGTILRTNDGGNTWIDQSISNDIVCLYTQFITKNIGWVASGSAILKTTDGGSNWFIQDSSGMFYYTGCFIDSLTGWIAGYNISKTTDGGNTWFIQYYSDPVSLSSIYFIDNNNGFSVGYDWNNNQGIFLKTSDGGNNWQSNIIGLNKDPRSIFFIDLNLGWIAGTDNNTFKAIILRTTDGGSNWSEQLNGSTDIYLSAIKFLDSLTGWAFGNLGSVLKTTNGGNNWIFQTTGNFITSFLQPAVVNQNMIFAVGDYATILKTSDGGQIWQNLTNGSTDYLRDVFLLNTDLVWATGESTNGNIFKTTNGGNTWMEIVAGIPGSLNSIYFITPDIGWACGLNGTIIKSFDSGLNWQTQNSGVSSHLWGLCFFDTQTGLAIGDNGKIIKTTNGGTNWLLKVSGTNEYLLSIFFNGLQNSWIGGTNGVMLKSTDWGDNWTSVIVSPQFNCYSIFFLNNNIGWCVGNNGIYAVAYKTADGGNSWEFVFDYPWWAFESIEFIDQFNGCIIGGNTILYTTNGGTSWFERGLISGNYLNDIEFADNSLVGWVVGGNGTILKTINGGGILPVELISFSYTVTESGVLLKWSTSSEMNNLGYEVQRRTTENDYVNIGFVPGFGTTTEVKAYNFTDSEVHTGSYIYRLKQIDFNGSFEYSDEVEIEVSMPWEFSLEQNYPNPFNPSTKISWQSPVGSWQILKIYDVLGNEVATLVDEYKPAGKYEVEWDASNHPSGIYFYQLKAGGFVSTKKMILIK